jgi:hypothetical protein
VTPPTTLPEPAAKLRVPPPRTRTIARPSPTHTQSVTHTRAHTVFVAANEATLPFHHFAYIAQVERPEGELESNAAETEWAKNTKALTDSNVDELRVCVVRNVRELDKLFDIGSQSTFVKVPFNIVQALEMSKAADADAMLPPKFTHTTKNQGVTLTTHLPPDITADDAVHQLRHRAHVVRALLDGKHAVPLSWDWPQLFCVDHSVPVADALARPLRTTTLNHPTLAAALASGVQPTSTTLTSLVNATTSPGGTAAPVSSPAAASSAATSSAAASSAAAAASHTPPSTTVPHTPPSTTSASTAASTTVTHTPPSTTVPTAIVFNPLERAILTSNPRVTNDGGTSSRSVVMHVM